MSVCAHVLGSEHEEQFWGFCLSPPSMAAVVHATGCMYVYTPNSFRVFHFKFPTHVEAVNSQWCS